VKVQSVVRQWLGQQPASFLALESLLTDGTNV